LIAQAIPGARVRFQAISLEEARGISLRREYSLRRFLERQ
jgi:allophanate hydrolase subunit 2